MNRVNLADRHDVFNEDLNAISDLMSYNIKQRMIALLKDVNKSYIIRGLNILSSANPNSFGIDTGVGVTNIGEFVIVSTQQLNIGLADTTVGNINVVTLSWVENPDTDSAADLGPIGELPDISPRPTRGHSVTSPISTIQPTRIYDNFIVHVEAQADYDALTDSEKAGRINLRKLVTPSLLPGGLPGFVDPNGIADPNFPQIFQLNIPPNSIDSSSIINFGLPLQTHQIEAHVNFIYGTKSDLSLTGTIVTSVNDFLSFVDVNSDKSYYIDGLRFVTGGLTNFDVIFNPITDASGVYIIWVFYDKTSGSLSFQKGFVVADQIDSLPIAVVTWDAITGKLTNLTDIRNFKSIAIDNTLFQFLAPLFGLFGTGYFQGALSQLLVQPSITGGFDIQVLPGYGLAQDPSKTIGSLINLPTGEILTIDPPDVFNASEVINNIQPLGPFPGATMSIVYTLITNGVPPHACQNLVATGNPGPTTLVEGTNYIFNRAAGTIQFIFAGLVSDGSDVNLIYQYGLPRIDIVALDQFGNFSIVKGVSAQVPVKPALAAGLYEWALVGVRELETNVISTDITPGEDYIALTRGFNYCDANKLGFPELCSLIGSTTGVTGENLLSKTGLTINARLDNLDQEVGIILASSPNTAPRLAADWDVFFSPTGFLDVASFDPVLVAHDNDFTRVMSDLMGVPPVPGLIFAPRFHVTYQDNVSNMDDYQLCLDLRRADKSLIEYFAISLRNVLSIPTPGLSKFFSVWYNHVLADNDVYFYMYINNSSKTLTNAINGAVLPGLTVNVMKLRAEIWQLFSEDSIS